MKNVCWLLFICCLFQVAAAQKKPVARPNIIYIYSDDLGFGELGVYGQQKIKTPNLDRMALEGIRFTNHYTSAPVCAPARCMLLTGRHSGHSYIRGNYELGGFADSLEGGQMPLPYGTITLGHLLKQAGYSTAAIGKWGLGMTGNTGHPNLQGFDYFYGYLDQKQAHNHYPTHLWENGHWDTLPNPPIDVHERPADNLKGTALFNRYKGRVYATDKLTEKAVTFIRQHRKSPFFLYLPYTLPHLSLQVSDSMIQVYKGLFEEKPYLGTNGYSATEFPRSAYAAMITYLDAQVGRILQLLKDEGLDQNTIIMFSSDNGSTFDVGGVDTKFFSSTAGLRGRKQDLYEGGIRMPFIARWPGRIKAGSVSDHISAQYDLMATLAELAGVPAPITDGISFFPALLGKTGQQQHPFLYFEFPEKSGQVAIRIGKWKGVKSNLWKNRQSEWELYNLDADPFEEHDSAASHPEILQLLDKVLLEQHQNAHIAEWEFLNNRVRK